jgi:arsenate reductase (glutaredoxin)
MTITIWHNPDCGTSRTVLAIIRAAGFDPVVVDYRKTPPDAATLARVAAAVGGAATLLRIKGTPAEELGLVGAADAAILAAMGDHPILINRPVVITPDRTILARPADAVRAVLEGMIPPEPAHNDAKPVARR